MTEPIDTGDTVKHGPTGERWIVAYVRGERIAWVGWPEGEASLANCELIEKATPAYRDNLLQEMAASPKDDDARVRYARARLQSSARDAR